jgi:hypothetical protein
VPFALLFGILVFLPSSSPALAQQDPCEGHGPDCRVLTRVEASALKERLLALRAVLPVPDPARWAPPAGVGDSFTMPFIAELNLGSAMTSSSWPAGAFTELNVVHFIYDISSKSQGKPQETKDLFGLAGRILGGLGNRIEVLAKLLPHAYLVDNIDGKAVDVNDLEATNIEKTPAFLSWQSNEGTQLTVVFGPRTIKETETDRVERPAKTLAPVKSVTLEITAPDKTEIAALKKKIDRKAFEALLGPMMK